VKKNALRSLVAKYAPEHIVAGDAYIDKLMDQTTVVRVSIDHLAGKARKLKCRHLQIYPFQSAGRSVDHRPSESGHWALWHRRTGQREHRQMTQKSVSLITAILLTIAFCTFIMAYEKRAMATAQSRIDTHARIIEDAMWNYNHQGIQEYLKLAAFSDRYESLTVNHQNGEAFQEINGEPATGLDRLLIDVRLMPRVQLSATVQHQGDTIGRMEAVWIPETIYMHAYVFFALVMVFVSIQLYLRLLKSKTRLEERVRERTAEVMATNLELKQEIEERIRAEKALRASEQKHRLLSENINDIIWTMDLELNYTYISPVAAKVQGWEPAELEGLTIDQVLTPASIEKASQIFAEQMAIGKRTKDFNRHSIMELEVYRKNGSTIICEVTASFMLDENGQPTGILGVTRDISERRRAEKEKADLERQLERSKKWNRWGSWPVVWLTT
jgi:PAS domain S-box-containing protein